MNYPVIFSKFETDFTTFGLAVLENAKSVKVKTVVNGEFTLSLILPRNDLKWQYVLEENFILVDSQLFRIRTFDEIRDNTGKLLSNIQCEHAWYDANDCKFIPDFSMIGATPTAILQAAFSGTRFTVGTVDASLTNTDIELSKTNPAAVANKLIENVGGELERDNYTIGLRARIGNNNGVQFRTGKNNANLKKTTDSKGLCTRLYPYGTDDLDITSVNGGIAYLDSQYINNYDYDHARFIDYRDIEDPAELKTKALAEFSTSEKDGIDKPKVTYEISAIELKKLSGHPFETFALGDSVRIIDEDLNIDVNARVMEYEYYPYEPLRSSVVLANFRNNIGKFLANLADSRNKLNNLTTTTGKVKVDWLENIMSKLQTEIQEGLTKKVAMHDYGDMWVDTIENPTKAMAIVNGMFAISNTKKENGDWDWRVFGSGDGFTADLINAGKIHAVNIETSELVVGDNITFGLSAADIGAKPYDWFPSYGDITGLKPPTDADNTLGTIGANRLTYIDGNGIYTGTLTAQQINAIQGITLGANATIQWASLPSLPTAAQVGALPSDTPIPSQYTNAMALAAWANSNYATHIDANGVYSGSFNGGMFNINPLSDPGLESGLTIGGWYEGVWRGQALRVAYSEIGDGGWPGTVFSSPGGVTAVFDANVKFLNYVRFWGTADFTGATSVDFTGTTVSGLNVIAKLG